MTHDELAVLRAELAQPAYTALTAAHAYGTLAGLLNLQAPYANPTPPAQVIPHITFGDVFGAIEPSDAALLKDAPAWAVGMVEDALKAGDIPALLTHIQLFAAWGFLSPASVTAIQALFNQTVPDPDWPPTLYAPSRAAELGLPWVRPEDIQTVLND